MGTPLNLSRATKLKATPKIINVLLAMLWKYSFGHATVFPHPFRLNSQYMPSVASNDAKLEKADCRLLDSTSIPFVLPHSAILPASRLA